MQSNGRNNLKILENDIIALQSEDFKSPIDIAFQPLCKEFNRRYRDYRMPEFGYRLISPFSYNHTDTATLLFSGGKVSLATALWLKDMGKDFRLLHFADGDDVDKSKKIIDLMRQLNVPYNISSTELPNNNFTDIWMLHEAVNYAINTSNAPTIYIGCFEMASMVNNKKKDWRHCDEFIGTYNVAVQKYVEGAKVIRLLPNYEMVDDILSSNKKYQYIQ